MFVLTTLLTQVAYLDLIGTQSMINSSCRVIIAALDDLVHTLLNAE